VTVFQIYIQYSIILFLHLEGYPWLFSFKLIEDPIQKRIRVRISVD